MHAIDNLGGKLGSFDRLEKGLQDGETWSQYDRALDGLGLLRGAGPTCRAEPLQPARRRASPACRRAARRLPGRMY